MKISLLIASVLLLIASLFGVVQAYTLPPETETEESVTLLEYQHEGKFDYLVYLKPSHLFGPEPQEPPPPPSNLKYPTEIIDRFNLTFSYRFVPDRPVGGISEEVEVSAIVKSPGVKQEEITLVPRTSGTGDFTIDFTLDISDNTSDNYITIGDNISGSDITITAYVYTTVETDTGPIFEGFTQSLSMRSRGLLVEVDGDLKHTQPGYVGELNYEQKGEFNYVVYLKPDSPFGSRTLKPPSVTPPTPLPPKTLGSEDTIFPKLVDGMNASFSYGLEASKLVRQVDEEVEINAIVENPGMWSKTIDLIPLTRKSGDFTITFPLDLNQFTEIFDTIQQETGVPASVRDLTIMAKVHTVAETDFGMIDEEFTHSITTDLKEGILAWDGDLEKSEPRSIETTQVVRQQEKYLGLPVIQARILFAIVAGILFILFIFSLLMYFRARPEKPTRIQKEAQRAGKKYKDLIMEIRELPQAKPGETVILLDSLDDLIKAAQGLLKPVLHRVDKEKHTYCIIDGGTRYQYLLANSKKEQGSNA